MNEIVAKHEISNFQKWPIHSSHAFRHYGPLLRLYDKAAQVRLKLQFHSRTSGSLPRYVVMALEQIDAKRPRTDNTDNMMTSIRDLLDRQHQQLEQAICTQLETHKLEIKEELGGVKEDMSGVKDKMEALEERVSKLEEDTPPKPHERHQAGQNTPPPYSPCEVVVGGWEDATKRADLLTDMEKILTQAAVKDQIQEVVVTGKRRSFVLLRLAPGSNHRAGIWKVVQAIKGLEIIHPNGKKLWVAPSKTPMERKRAAVANVDKSFGALLSM